VEAHVVVGNVAKNCLTPNPSPKTERGAFSPGICECTPKLKFHFDGLETQIPGATAPFPNLGKGLGWGCLTPGPSPTNLHFVSAGKAERGTFSLGICGYIL